MGGDYASRDQNNRTLGLLGEKLVVEYERALLLAHGLHDLASKVRHIAIEEGDGAGYDVLSFQPSGAPLYIEVKTTRGPATAEFFITANEVEFSRLHGACYELRRVHSYLRDSGTFRFFSVHSSLADEIDLTPTTFKVSNLKLEGNEPDIG